MRDYSYKYITEEGISLESSNGSNGREGGEKIETKGRMADEANFCR